MARVLNFRGSAVGVIVNGATVPASTLFTDVILGSNFDDNINALNGRDLVYGYGGNDQIFGGAGFDRIFGGDGNDTIFDDDRGGRLDGGNGNDSITGGDGAYVYGGFGADEIVAGDRSRVYGDLFNNRSAGNADDIFVGAQSVVNAGAGADYVVVGLGSTARGDTGDDILTADVTRGDSARTTTLDGGVGDDLFFFDADSAGRVKLKDSSGDDLMVFADFDSTALDARREGNNLVIEVFDPDNVDESGPSPILSPSTYATITVTGQYSGANTIELLAFTEPGAENVRDGTVDTEDLITYELRRSLDGSRDDDNQMLVGTGEADEVTGGAGDDILFGGAGADTLIGDDEIEGSDDILVGGRGADLLLGGDGEDLFRFSFADLGTGIDTIADFDINNDILDLTELLRLNESINATNNGFVVAVQQGDDLLIRVDIDGRTNADGGVNSNVQSVVVLSGVDRRDIDLAYDFSDPTANVLF